MPRLRPARTYKIPSRKSNSAMDSLYQLLSERSSLQSIATSWEKDVLSTHRTEVAGAMSQQKRKVEKLFGSYLQNALQLNKMNTQDLLTRESNNPAGSVFTTFQRLLSSELNSVTQPRTRSRTTTAETTRSQESLSRFRASGSNMQDGIQSAQTRALRNR